MPANDAPRPYDTLLFDVDNTLLDFVAAETHALRSAFEDLGAAYEERYLGDYQTVNSALWRELERGTISIGFLKDERFRQFCQRIHPPFEPEDFGPRFMLHLGESGFAIPGAVAIVARLAPYHRMAIVTNGLASVQHARLRRSGLDRYFSAVVVSEEVGVQKPDSAIFSAAFQALALDSGEPTRRRTLMIGDSLTSDIRGGRDFGCATCWFNPSHRRLEGDIRPDIVIEELRDLVDLCRLP